MDNDTPNTDGDTDLMALASQADSQPDTASSPAAAPQEPVKQADEQAGAENKGGEPAKDAAKPDTKKSEDQPKPDDQKPESAYTKAKKESERRDRSWKKLEEEKAQLRREQEELTRQRAEMTRDRSDRQRSTPAKPEHTPEEYEALARHYQEQGDAQMAAAALQKAGDLRDQLKQGATQQATAEPWKQPEFQAAWQQNVDAMVQADPTLSDPANPVVTAANSLVNNPAYSKYFRAAPDGIRAAVEVGRMVVEITESRKKIPALQQELDQAKAEIQRLNKCTAIGGSLPASGKLPAKKPEDIPDDDLLKAAMAADREAVV